VKALLLAAAALLSTPALAQTVAITGGTVAIGDGSAPIGGGTVVFRDGRIVAAGRGVAVPAGAQVIDATGKWVAAGIVSGLAQLGLMDIPLGDDASNDVSAQGSPFNAAIDVAPAINANNFVMGNERAGGVTRGIVAPGAAGSIFAGQGAVIDLGEDPDAITRPRAFQFVELGQTGSARAGGSRPAAYALLRDALAQAQDFRRNPAAFDGRSRDALIKRGDAQALLRVLDGTAPLVVHVERASDIRSVLALPREFSGLKLVLLGAAEGWMAAREIAAANVPVIAGALVDLPASFEMLAATDSNVGRLRQAGVKVALATINANDGPGEHILAQYAGNLVGIAKTPGKVGLPWGEAFATVTSAPAEALGMGGEIGSLRPGRRADVVIWDGDPLELSSRPQAVWIDGRAQSVRSRQVKLRDRYRQAGEGALPKAYDR
jgi:imidazolonepropionase-like amidohydrolase